MKKFLIVVAALLIPAALTIVALGSLLHLRALARQNAVRTAEAPKGGTYLNAGDCEIFTQEQGNPNSPAVLFVGGTGAWSDNWRNEIKIAADAGFHAIAMDLPPFGYSTKPTNDNYTRGAQAARIVALVESAKVRRLVIVAHSFGGSPAITAASMMPEKVLAVLLIDPALGWGAPGETRASPPSPLVTSLLGSRLFRLPLAAIFTHPEMQKGLLQRVLFKKEMATDEKVEIFKRQMNVQGKSEEIAKWLADFITIPDPEYIEHPEFFKKVTAPVTLLWGDHDDITPLWQGEQLAKLLPNAKLKLLKGVGHVPQIEDPTAFQQALKDFLKQVH